MAGPVSPVAENDGRGAYGTRRLGLASALLSENETKAYLAEPGQVRVGMAPPKRTASSEPDGGNNSGKKLKAQKGEAAPKRTTSSEPEGGSNNGKKLKTQKGEAAPA